MLTPYITLNIHTRTPTIGILFTTHALILEYLRTEKNRPEICEICVKTQVADIQQNIFPWHKQTSEKDSKKGGIRWKKRRNQNQKPQEWHVKTYGMSRWLRRFFLFHLFSVPFGNHLTAFSFLHYEKNNIVLLAILLYIYTSLLHSLYYY